MPKILRIKTHHKRSFTLDYVGQRFWRRLSHFFCCQSIGWQLVTAAREQRLTPEAAALLFPVAIHPACQCRLPLPLSLSLPLVHVVISRTFGAHGDGKRRPKLKQTTAKQNGWHQQTLGGDGDKQAANTNHKRIHSIKNQHLILLSV